VVINLAIILIVSAMGFGLIMCIRLAVEKCPWTEVVD